MRVGIAEQVQKSRGWRAVGHAFQEGDSVGGLALIKKELGELLDGRFVFRIIFQNAAENGFGFVMLVAQTIEASQPESRFGIRRIQTIDFFVLLDGLAGDLRLAYAGAQITEAAKVDSSQEATGGSVVRMALENFLSFRDSVTSTLGFPIHFGQTLADDRRLGV